MTRKATPDAPRARSGKVHEAQRHTHRVVLRLPPETAQSLRHAAIAQEMGLSAYVTRLLQVMQAHPEVTCGTLLEDIRGPFR